MWWFSSWGVVKRKEKKCLLSLSLSLSFMTPQKTFFITFDIYCNVQEKSVSSKVNIHHKNINTLLLTFQSLSADTCMCSFSLRHCGLCSIYKWENESSPNFHPMPPYHFQWLAKEGRDGDILLIQCDFSLFLSYDLPSFLFF